MTEKQNKLASSADVPVDGKLLSPSAEVNISGKRRWLYGSNTAILIIIVAAVVVCLDFLSVRYNYRKDLTTGAIYSLSGRTKKLLAMVDQEKMPVYLVNLYPHGEPRHSAGLEEFLQGRKVEALIKEYTRNSHYVREFNAAGRRKELEEKIRGRFKGQFAPYRAVAMEFGSVAAKTGKFLATEAADWGNLAASPGLNAMQQQAVLSVQSVFADDLPRALAHTRSHVDKALKATLPDWPGVSKELSQSAKVIASNLKMLLNPNSLEQATNVKLGPKVRAYLTSRIGAYHQELAMLAAYQTKIADIKPMRAGAILHQLAPDSLLVMGPDKIKVIHGTAMFKPRSTGLGQPPSYAFNGEQAVNSALLGLIQKHPTKVVFVSVDPANLISTGGPFSHIATLLTGNNFKVYQWSPTPANPQQGASPPPAIGKGVIWVVLQLPPPGQASYMAGMMNQQLEAAIKQQLSQGGHAMFLLGSMPQELLMATGGKMPFKGLLSGYGVRIRPTYSIVQRTRVSRHGFAAIPQMQITHYPDTPIGRPLASLATLFAGQLMAPNEFLLAPTVIEPMVPAVKGTQVKVIIKSPSGADIWGQPSGYSGSARFKTGVDLPTPLPMGVMAEKGDTRIVVIGNLLFASNQILESGQPYMTGGQLGWVYNYPGNAELFLNAMYWLAGESHLIGVSPRATVALRIGQMSPAEETVVRLGSFLGPACVAILAGFVVFLVRRRV